MDDVSVLNGPYLVGRGYENHRLIGVGSWSGKPLSSLMLVSSDGIVTILNSKGLTGSIKEKTPPTTVSPEAELIALGPINESLGGTVVIIEAISGNAAIYGASQDEWWSQFPVEVR